MRHRFVVALLVTAPLVACSAETETPGTSRSGLAVATPKCPAGTGQPVTCENEALHLAKEVGPDPNAPCPDPGFTYVVHATCCPLEAMNGPIPADGVPTQDPTHRRLAGDAVACTPILDAL